MQRKVALKVLAPHLSENDQFIKRFQREARVVGKIHSPHVVQAYGAGEADGLHFIAMEYVDGEDLFEKMSAEFQPSPQQALQIIKEAAQAISDAGRLGIIHRDIKPHNIMIDRTGRVKVMDFGLAKLLDDEQGLTNTGQIMGTVAYLSPEQALGEICDTRSDIYSLGVVFYELVTGRLPFVADDAPGVLQQHLHNKPALPSAQGAGDESFDTIILTC